MIILLPGLIIDKRPKGGKIFQILFRDKISKKEKLVLTYRD
jgi:hypothetical protein